jgi:hypothetical protein
LTAWHSRIVRLRCARDRELALAPSSRAGVGRGPASSGPCQATHVRRRARGLRSLRTSTRRFRRRRRRPTWERRVLGPGPSQPALCDDGRPRLGPADGRGGEARPLAAPQPTASPSLPPNSRSPSRYRSSRRHLCSLIRQSNACAAARLRRQSAPKTSVFGEARGGSSTLGDRSEDPFRVRRPLGGSRASCSADEAAFSKR